MTSQEIVQWDNNNSDKDKELSETFKYGADEGWISKKKVATTTTKNIEKRVKRQVVLEDGRIIEEDDPEITRDKTEDTRTNENENDEDIQRLPSIKSIDPNWTPGDRILSERQEQNVETKDTSERTTTMSAGYNMGDLKNSDLEKVLRQGRTVKSVITPYDEDKDSKSLAIPTQVMNTSSSRHLTIDKENIHEVNRIDGEKLRTDRMVTREFIEDKGSETPEEGEDSIEETDLRDGNKKQYSRRKEERYIDYYKVPKGKSLNEGTKLGRGIHMTSTDADERPIPYPRRDKSIGYENGKNKEPNKRWSTASSFRSASSSREDSPSRIPSHLDKERLGRLKRSMSFQSKNNHDDYSSNPSPFKSNSIKEKKGKKSFLGSLKSLYSSILLKDPPNHQKDRVDEANKAWFDQHYTQHNGNDDDDDDEEGEVDYDDDSRPHRPRRPPRRQKSTNSKPSNKSSSIISMSTSNFSVKSPNSTLNRNRRNSRPKINVTEFERDDSATRKPRSSPSSRHPSNRGSPASSVERKHKHSPSTIKHNGYPIHGSNRASPASSLERPSSKRLQVPNYRVSPASSVDHAKRAQDYHTSSLDRRPKKNPPSRTTDFFSLDRKQHRRHHHKQDSKPPSSSSTFGRISKSLQNSFNRVGSSPPRHPPPPPPTGESPAVSYHNLKRNSVDQGSLRSSNNGVQRRQTFAAYDNRDSPRFEPERHRRRFGSRYFGQDDDSEIDMRSRPPPDMRRLLLHGVNESRRKAMSKEIESKPTDVRAV